MARAELDKKKEEEQSSRQLTTKITEVSTLAHGELLLTLDNGQMWQQKTADRALRVKAGDQVTIKRGAQLVPAHSRGHQGVHARPRVR